MNEYQEFTSRFKASITAASFVKLTLSNPAKKDAALQNVYVRLIVLKNIPNLSFTYRYKTNDQVKNKTLEEGISELESFISNDFKSAALFTTSQDLTLQTSKKGSVTLQKKKATFTEALEASHDRQKVKRASVHKQYLTELGIMDASGVLIPKMADKYRQINKYLEIIEGLITSVSLPEEINIVDMGSGKGYLTFALYDYLKNDQSLNVQVTGIE
ncbi:MAG: methyltransferase, partial [Cytophagales bacterium]|nr:methyltransferase [Cytophaga sp.]